MERADFLVIGAGIIGMAVALELKRRQPSASIRVLEKESAPGQHSSGRNSGVLHSGLYYAPGSLKARLCRQGALEMAQFHETHGLRLDRRGKFLVPTVPEFAAQMETIAARARENGVWVEKMDTQTLRELEPETRSATGEALWVPDTAVGNPGEVIRALSDDAQKQGIDLRLDAELVAVDPLHREARLKNGDVLHYGHFINAAGLHADRIAHLFDVGQRYALLPFKGLYWKLDPASGIHVRHLIYPVPDLRILYLGVHTTTASDGTIYLGPTAVPAFGRGNYRALKNISWLELPRMFGHLARMFMRDEDGFRQQAWEEGRRFFKPWFAEAARALLPRLKNQDLRPATKVGLHPRLFDRERGHLLKDFIIETSSHATHILGAVSPAWTCAFPFARHVCDQFIEGL